MDTVNVPRAALHLSARSIQTAALVVERNLANMERVRACMQIMRDVAKDLELLAEGEHDIQRPLKKGVNDEAQQDGDAASTGA